MLTGGNPVPHAAQMEQLGENTWTDETELSFVRKSLPRDLVAIPTKMSSSSKSEREGMLDRLGTKRNGVEQSGRDDRDLEEEEKEEEEVGHKLQDFAKMKLFFAGPQAKDLLGSQMIVRTIPPASCLFLATDWFQFLGARRC